MYFSLHGCPYTLYKYSSLIKCGYGRVYIVPKFDIQLFIIISIKVVPEQSGKNEYESEMLAGSDD